jgi:hypothetical protein
VYNVPAVQPAAPFVAGLPVVFQQITGPVAALIATDCAPAYVPAIGKNVGVEAVGVLDENVAVTAVAELTVRLQVLVPEQPPPDQPTNSCPTPGVAVRTVAVGVIYVAKHCAVGQLICERLSVTPPVPTTVIVSTLQLMPMKLQKELTVADCCGR